jgi:hypothetical protein
LQNPNAKIVKSSVTAHPRHQTFRTDAAFVPARCGIHFGRDGFFGLRLQFSALAENLFVVASFGMVQQSFGFRSIASEFVKRKSVFMAAV